MPLSRVQPSRQRLNKLFTNACIYEYHYPFSGFSPDLRGKGLLGYKDKVRFNSLIVALPGEALPDDIPARTDSTNEKGMTGAARNDHRFPLARLCVTQSI